MPNEQHPEAVQRPPEWLRVTLASIGDAVITTDPNGAITFMNAVAESLTGWKLQEARGMSLDLVFKIVNEETRRTVENPATRAMREGIVVGLANHTVLIAKDGTERCIDDSAAPIRNERGEVIGVVLLFRDVTERRKADEALRQSEERFRLLVEAVQDYAIFMLDPRGHIASWNMGAERIKGYRAEEIIGKHFSCFYPKEAIERGWPEEELQKAKALGRFEDEGWRLRKDGSMFWANVIITALRKKSGELIGFSKVTRDLTERKRAEEECRQLERTKAVAEISADLNRRKDEFLAMLSHELRNPLAAIFNATHLLRLEKSAGPMHRQATSIIERQLGSLKRLVDDLLEVSRITTGRIRLEQETLDLRGVVERALEGIRPKAQQRKHELSVSLPPEPLWVHADAVRLEQIVGNLLNNAVKYTDPGGHIWLKLERENHEAVLRVQDTGIGISSEVLPGIFDLFTQADKSLDRSEGGLGVGLTIVQRVVEMHGGRVEAKSPGLGHGSEFVVRLPLSLPESSTLDRTPPEVAEKATALRILVVDDNKDTADSAAVLLGHSGHLVRVAYSGPEALEAVLAYRPNVVLLDIGLPGMDGYEVARRIREIPECKGVRLIATTGYGQDTDRQGSEEAGFDAHLTKPVDLEEVEELLVSFAGSPDESLG
jgi:PAS domain S-box-containing protein